MKREQWVEGRWEKEAATRPKEWSENVVRGCREHGAMEEKGAGVATCQLQPRSPTGEG